MIDDKKRFEILESLTQTKFGNGEGSGVSEEEENGLFQTMINPIKNPRGYATLRDAFKINPLCEDCYMVFVDEIDKSNHTPEECAVNRVHDS